MTAAKKALNIKRKKIVKPRRLTENRSLLRESRNQPFFTLDFVK